MADSDVKLVIKARDEASSALSKVNKALQALTESQKKAAKAGESSGKSLSDVQAALEKLQGGKAAKAFSSLTKALTEARAGFENLKAELSSSERDLRRLADRTANAAVQSDKLAVAQERAAKAVAKHRQAVSDSVSARRAAVAEEKKAAQAVKSLEREEAKLLAARKRNAAQIDKTRQAFVKYSEAVRSTEKPTSTLIEKQRRAAEALAKLTAKSLKLSSTLTDVRAGLSAAEKEFARSAEAVKKAESALATQRAELERLKAAYGATSASAREAERHYQSLAGQLGKARSAHERLTAAVRKARTEYSGIASQVSKARSAFKAVETDLRRQEKALKASETAYRSNNRAFREFVQTVSQGRKTLADFFSVQRRTGEVTQRNATAFEKLSKAIRDSASGTDRAASSTRRYAAEIVKSNRKTAHSLTLAQRWTAQVRSLTAQYLGLFAAFRGAGQMIDVQQRLEATQRKLGVVLNTLDGGKIAKEYKWVSDEADRLGLDIQKTADNFASFAIAATKSGISLSDTKDIFISVSEAARVMNLSAHETELVFVALTQIASKQIVSMEELRQQLGEHVAGAIQIMAKAAGYGENQMKSFFKAISQGKIGADTLVKFGEELHKVYGPQLATALHKNSAEFQRMKNAWTKLVIEFNKAGALDALTRLFRQLNETLRDQEFIGYARTVSRAVAKVIDVLTWMGKHFKITSILVAAVVLKMTFRIGTLLQAFMGFRGAAGVATAALTRVAPAATVATAALSGLFRGIAAGLAAFARVPPQALLVVAALAAIGAGLYAMTQRAQAASTETEKLGQAQDVAARAGERLFVSTSRGVPKAALDSVSAFRAEVSRLRADTERPFVISVKVSGSAALSPVGKEIGRLVSLFGELEPKSASLSRSLGGVSSAFSRVGASIQGLDKGLGGLGKSSSEIAKSLAEAQKPLASFSVYVNGLVKTVPELARGLGKTAKHLGAMRAAVSTLGKNLSKLSKELSDIAASAEETTTALKSFAATAGDIEALAESLLAVATRYAETRGELEKIARAAEDLARSAEKANTALQSVGEFAFKIRDLGRAYQFVSRAIRDAIHEVRKFSNMGADNVQAQVDVKIGVGLIDAGLAHTGGLVGQKRTGNNGTRAVNPSIFSGAERYATGGIAGLAPDEVPTILHAGEEVLTTNDPRHRNNLRGGSDRLVREIRALVKAVYKGFMKLNRTILMVGEQLHELVQAIKNGGLSGGQAGSSSLSSSSAASAYTRTPSGEGNTPVGNALNQNAPNDGSFWPVPQTGSGNIGGAGLPGGSGGSGSGAAGERHAPPGAWSIVKNSYERAVGEYYRTPRSPRDAEGFASSMSSALSSMRGTVELSEHKKDVSAWLDRLSSMLSGGFTSNPNMMTATWRGIITSLYESLSRAVSSYHQGGVVTGSSPLTHVVPAGVFSGAPKYQTGGIAGLRPDEVPAILHRGEEVLTTSDPRHRNNRAPTGGMDINVRVEGVSDFASAVQRSADSWSQIQSKAMEELFWTLHHSATFFGAAVSKAAAALARSVSGMEAAITKFSGSLSSYSPSGNGGSGANSQANQPARRGWQSFVAMRPIGAVVLHRGGIVGGDTSGVRKVPDFAFLGASRFHSGGIPGVRPNEVPAILERGEEVLTANDPRHSANTGAAAPSVKIVNAFDAGSFISEGASTDEGEEAILNVIRANAGTIKEIIQ